MLKGLREPLSLYEPLLELGEVRDDTLAQGEVGIGSDDDVRFRLKSGNDFGSLNRSEANQCFDAVFRKAYRGKGEVKDEALEHFNIK